MKFRTREGNDIHVFETNWFTFKKAGHYNWFFVSVRDKANTKILKHELRHHDQRKREGLRFFRMLFDMDYLVRMEVEAYLKSGETDQYFIARTISRNYKVSRLGKLLGFRTKPYDLMEVMQLL